MGADMEWREATDVGDVPPNATFSSPLTPTVQGESPQAILALEYHWSDATGKSLREGKVLWGDPLKFSMEEPFLSQVSPNVVLAMIGALLGLGTWRV